MNSEIEIEKNRKIDRIHKYGYGGIRLFLLLMLLGFSIDRIETISVTSYGIFGIGGATLNLHFLSTSYQLLILFFLIFTFVVKLTFTSTAGRAILLLYLCKTIGGDGLAGKLDHVVWFRSLAIVLVLWTLLSHVNIVPWLPNYLLLFEILKQNSFIFISHLTSHWICEIGDNKYENIKFFRYRYTYELLSIFLFVIDGSSTNKELVILDMTASLGYRLTNFVYTVM